MWILPAFACTRSWNWLAFVQYIGHLSGRRVAVTWQSHTTLLCGFSQFSSSFIISILCSGWVGWVVWKSMRHKESTYIRKGFYSLIYCRTVESVYRNFTLFLKCPFTKTGFPDSDAEYVISTQFSFPDTLSTKTTKLLRFSILSDIANAGPDLA